MSSTLPLVVRKLVNLSEAPFELPESSFRYGYLSIESDKYICIKQVLANETNVVIVDLHNNNAITKKPTKKAEAAIMHTTKNIIVLKGRNAESSTGHFIQIFNLDTQDRVLDHVFHDDVVFWKWASDTLLANSIFCGVWHLWCSENIPPYKVFDRAGQLASGDVQIIHYVVDNSLKWCLLSGIYSHDKRHIQGVLQLYSIERMQHQLLTGHAGCFGSLMVSPLGHPPIDVFCYAEKTDSRCIVHIMNLDASKSLNDSKEGFKMESSVSETSFRVAGEVVIPDDLKLDFPIFMHLNRSEGLLYLVTRGGCLAVLDPFTAVQLFVHRVSSDAVFASCVSSCVKFYKEDETGSGILLVNRKGVVYSTGLREAALVPYIQQTLVHLPMSEELAQSFVRRYGYSGAPTILVQLFNAAFSCGDWTKAARIAATALAKNILRTPETLKRFQCAPSSAASGMTPLLQYFTILLDNGRLNSSESLELIRTVVSQNHVELVERWLSKDKLTCTEELGDAVKIKNPDLALRIYDKAKAVGKVLQTSVEQGKYEHLQSFISQMKNSQSTGGETLKISSAELESCLRSLLVANNSGSVDAAVMLSQGILNIKSPVLMDIEKIIGIFLQNRKYREITKILLEFLKDDKPEDGHLQTRLFEISFAHNPNVVEAIFQAECFTHYDRKRVAMLAEKTGHIQRALLLSSDPEDIKRLIVTHFSSGNVNMTCSFSPEWFAGYFESTLVKMPEIALGCLQAILRGHPQNAQMVVQIAIKNHEQLGIQALIHLFESHGCWDGLYKFLGTLAVSSQDPEVNFKYIEAAVRVNNLREVERVCRECTCYDPIRVKNFLKDAKLPDPRPLIYVCDLNGFVVELIEYLYHNNFTKFIEIYSVTVSPQKTPIIVGVLLDLDCSEDFIKSILNSVRNLCPISELIVEVVKRNRLRMLEGWLEARAAEGNQDPHLHNALAKIRIDTNDNPEEFLKTNMFYDSKTIGDYCVDRDPYLALVAYKKVIGTCDDEIIQVTQKNGLFRLQARYLVERQSSELWQKVLNVSNPHRAAVIDQVVSSALPESTLPGEICATVRAFVDANIPNALMELLEKIVLHNSSFSQNKNLQNLLIITAIKSAPERVVDYINKFENYDGLEVAQVLTAPECGMYEEALTIYTKCGKHEEAVSILLKNMKDMDRAIEYAIRCSLPEVWSLIAKEQLANNLVAEAIDSFIKAQDCSCYGLVISMAKKGNYSNLLPYLTMVKAKLTTKDSLVDSELLYLLVKGKKLGETQDLLAGPNAACVGAVADRFVQEEMYDEALILYGSIPNYSRVVACHLKKKDYQAAIEAAKKANNPKTWSDVNRACVNAGEFSAAHTAGLAILGHPDHLEDLIRHYEQKERFDELIELLEAGVSGFHRSSLSILTELGIIYAKYKPERLSGFLQSSLATLATGKHNVLKLVRVCEKELLWKECVQLYMSYGEFDEAALVMIHHPSVYSPGEFQAILQQCSNTELYYKALSFSLEIAPLEIPSLLKTLSCKLDHGRVVQQFRKLGHLMLLESYLEYVQKDLHIDRPVVNAALTEIYLKHYNVKGLTWLVEHCKNFDQVSLAEELEAHSLLEFRKLASVLYRKNKRFEQAMRLSKRDGFHGDAINAARLSNHVETAEDLLRYFILERQDLNGFLACVACCYHLIRPDVVLELAWRHKCTDAIMPFIIQTLRHYSTRLDAMEKKCTALENHQPSLASPMVDPSYNAYAYPSKTLALTSFPARNVSENLDPTDMSEYTFQSATGHRL